MSTLMTPGMEEELSAMRWVLQEIAAGRATVQIGAPIRDLTLDPNRRPERITGDQVPRSKPQLVPLPTELQMDVYGVVPDGVSRVQFAGTEADVHRNVYWLQVPETAVSRENSVVWLDPDGRRIDRP